ncbi:MAG: tagaturonate epimerase family protein [Thermodesulfobacteriota bacterium]
MSVTAPQNLLHSLKGFPVAIEKIYPKSFTLKNGLTYGLIRTAEGKKLVVLGENDRVLKDPFQGKSYRQATTLKLCDLTNGNTDCLMELFPFTKPVSLREHRITIGTGDRLGVATAGHIRAVRTFRVRPVLAQQSVRENTQTGRSFEEVVSDAAWAVFQENYADGYGADGDHLKSLQETKEALRARASMITLDLSEKLNPLAFDYSKGQLARQFGEEIEKGDREVWLHLFLDKEFSFRGRHGEFSIRFDEESVKRNLLLFHKAIDFTEEVYQFILSEFGNRRGVDFEISVDETPFPTTPENHLFFIIALSHRGVRIDALAPRFIGEFQKAIDYRGHVGDFRKQFYQHALIARDYGNYRISIHSGSDKFSVFPSMGELSEGGLHLKTAGTSWLEAVRLIASLSPPLYREMHRFAVRKFGEAAKLYHVTTDLKAIPDLDELRDQELPALLDKDNSRQLLHITYGYLLNAKDDRGRHLFKERIYETLFKHEEEYWSLLEKHIGRHLSSLGVDRRDSEPDPKLNSGQGSE